MAVRGSLSLIGFLVLAYLFFLVPLGSRTMHEHVCRILETEPARELGSEAWGAGQRLAEEVRSEWQARQNGEIADLPLRSTESALPSDKKGE